MHFADRKTRLLFLLRAAADLQGPDQPAQAEEAPPIRGLILPSIRPWERIPGDYGNWDGMAFQ